MEVQVLLAMDDGLDPVRLRFLAEARRASALQSPNVAVIREVGVTPDGHPFLVREARTGESLRELLARVGSLPTESAVDVAVAVCEVLAAAHAIGIVHGELSTSTVRLAWSDAGATHVKVVDLGISRALRMLPLDARTLESLSISAPELLQGNREPDHRSDAWGVGVLLYTMLAGAPPFAADSPSTVNLSVALDEPAMLAGVPDGLGDLVDACLARDPAHRPGTMQVLAAKLAPFGTQPVFAKRASTLVVETTGPYEALVLEDLVERATAKSLLPDDPHERVTPVPSLDRTPEPSVISQSTPPTAITVAPPPAPLRSSLAATLNGAPPARSRIPIFAAAACVAIGVIIGVGSTRISTEAPAAAAAGIVAAPPPPVAEAPLPRAPLTLAPLAPAPIAPAPVAPAPIAVADLRAAPAAPRARAAAAAPKAPAPTVDPLVQSAAAPIHPVPKASDDELRRFLDDRR